MMGKVKSWCHNNNLLTYIYFFVVSWTSFCYCKELYNAKSNRKLSIFYFLLYNRLKAQTNPFSYFPTFVCTKHNLTFVAEKSVAALWVQIWLKWWCCGQLFYIVYLANFTIVDGFAKPISLHSVTWNRSIFLLFNDVCEHAHTYSIVITHCDVFSFAISGSPGLSFGLIHITHRLLGNDKMQW